MAAPLSSPHDGRETAFDERVLSVSPSRLHASESEARMPMDSSSLEMGSGLADNTSEDECLRMDDPESSSLAGIAAEMSGMIEVAATTAETLNRRLHEVGEGEHRAAAASAQLQEQLRLGARMLKAFQSQIARVEDTLGRQQAYEQQVAETQAQIEQCFAGIETCIDKTLESVAYRLAEQARVAVARFDEGIAARQGQLVELDGRIAECAGGINGICEMIENVQTSVRTAVESNQSTLDRLQIAAADAQALLEKHGQAQETLVSEMREKLKALERSGTAVQEAMRETIALGSETDASLRLRLEEIDAARREHDRLSGSAAELRDMLVRLQPWEKLLLSGSIHGDGLPEPLAKVAGELRQQISQDMTWLNTTMRDVAQRVSTLATVATPAAPQAASSAAATAVAQESPAAPTVQVDVKRPRHRASKSSSNSGAESQPS